MAEGTRICLHGLGGNSTSSKDAIRWRPSQVGWRTSLLVTVKLSSMSLKLLGWRPLLLVEVYSTLVAAKTYYIVAIKDMSTRLGWT